MGFGKDGCRFDATTLELVIKKIIKEILGDETAKFAEPVGNGGAVPCPTYVVATKADIANGPATLFRSYSGKGVSADACAIWEAARATTAAPSFFKSISIRGNNGLYTSYVDGGIDHNNPVEFALKEAERIWGEGQRCYLVSVGTGRQKPVEVTSLGPSTDTPSQFGPIRVARRIASNVWPYFWPLNRLSTTASNIALSLSENFRIAQACIELSTSSERAHQRLFDIAQKSNSQIKAYYRFNVDIGLHGIELQEWRQLQKLATITKAYMEEGERIKRRDDCVVNLMNPAGSSK